jgi:hypothetical protein
LNELFSKNGWHAKRLSAFGGSGGGPYLASTLFHWRDERNLSHKMPRLNNAVFGCALPSGMSQKGAYTGVPIKFKLFWKYFMGMSPTIILEASGGHSGQEFVDMAKRYKQSDQERQIVLGKQKSMFAKVDFEYMLPRDIKRNGRIEKQDMWLELLSTYEYATLQGDGFKKAFANAISNYTNIDCGFKLSDIDLVDPITREKTHVEIFHGELFSFFARKQTSLISLQTDLTSLSNAIIRPVLFGVFGGINLNIIICCKQSQFEGEE